MLNALFQAGVLSIAMSVAAAPSCELAPRVRAVAEEHDASISKTPVATYYSIFAYQPPRGYRTVMTLIERPDGSPTITVAIYERVLEEQQVSLLVDEGADCTLDYVLRTRRETLDDAVREVRSGRLASQRPSFADQRDYDELALALRVEVTTPGTW